MRTITVTEKYRAVQEGSLAKSEFVRQMRQSYPMYVSPVSDYNSTVQILKNRSLLFEAKEEVDDSFKYSDDSLRRAIDIELEAAGLMSHQSVSGEDQAKAKKKAIENLKKDPLHYYHLIAGESSKVDKHDKEAETKRGAGDVDTFNGLKKATLKEGHPKHADGTPKSNAEMTDDERENFYNDLDSVDKVDEKNYANFTAKKIKSDFKKATDSDIGGIDTSLDPYEDRKEIISQVVQLIKSSMPADNGTIKDFIRTHYDDIINLGDDEAILDEFQEFLSKGTVSSEKKGNLKVEEDFAPSPNTNVPDANAEEFDIATAFKKAGVDMSKPVMVLHAYGSASFGGSDETKMSAEAAIKKLEAERQENQKNYTDDGEEVPEDMHSYEFDNYSVLEEEMPEGHEYKLSYGLNGDYTYSITQQK